MPDEKKDPRQRGPVFEGNIAFGNGGAGFSVPAGFKGVFKDNAAWDNAAGGFVVRDDGADLLAAMQLRPDTPVALLAKAIVELRDRPATTEVEAQQAITKVGLGKWLVAKAPSAVAFIANLLMIADSPTGQQAMAHLLGH